MEDVDDDFLRDGVIVEVHVVCVLEVEHPLRALLAQERAYFLLEVCCQVRKAGKIVVVLMRCRGSKAGREERDIGKGFLAMNASLEGATMRLKATVLTWVDAHFNFSPNVLRRRGQIRLLRL